MVKIVMSSIIWMKKKSLKTFIEFESESELEMRYLIQKMFGIQLQNLVQSKWTCCKV